MKELDQIRERTEAATEGPWKAWDRGIGYEVHDQYDQPLNYSHRETFDKADAVFIARAREDVPRLLAALDTVLSHAEDRAKALRLTADRLNQEVIERHPERDHDAAIRYEHYALEAVACAAQLKIITAAALGGSGE